MARERADHDANLIARAGLAMTRRALAMALVAFVACFGNNSTTATPTGYHDGSNVSLTWGWACDSTQPTTFLTVYFFAEINDSLTQIGSTVANWYRNDLVVANACGGSGYHAFLFTAYPQSGVTNIVDAGSHDIYAYIFYNNSYHLLGGSPQNVSFAPTGLWDPGLANGRWRTDYYSQTAGLASNPPLVMSEYNPATGGDCWWTTPPIVPGGAAYNNQCLTRLSSALVTSPPTFPSSPMSPTPVGSYNHTYAQSSDGNFTAPNFWVIIANSEPAYFWPYLDGKSGPPDQTDPISSPGQGLYALAVLPDVEGGNPNRKKSHLIINKLADPERAAGKGNYLSYGVHSDWGNGHGVVILLNYPGPTYLNFASTLMDIGGASSDSQTAYVIIEAQWADTSGTGLAGKKRWAYITLMDENGTADDINADHFNWNIINSFLFPGADIVFKSVRQLNSECPRKISNWPTLPAMSTTCTYNNHCPTARYNYSIPIKELFNCLSGDFTTPMPVSGYIPITGIDFAIEQGPSTSAFTWIAIDSVELQ